MSDLMVKYSKSISKKCDIFVTVSLILLFLLVFWFIFLKKKAKTTATMVNSENV